MSKHLTTFCTYCNATSYEYVIKYLMYMYAYIIPVSIGIQINFQYHPLLQGRTHDRHWSLHNVDCCIKIVIHIIQQQLMAISFTYMSHIVTLAFCLTLSSIIW